MSDSRKGKFTIRTAGFSFFLSALFQMMSLKTGVPFLGNMLSGTSAVLYHLIYVSIFLGMGFVLWTGSRNGLAVIFGGTALFTMEKLLLLASRTTLQLYTDQITAFSPDILLLMDLDALRGYVVFITWVLLASWWGFTFYIYLRRDYFRS
ncbi:MAG: hypothetical protein GXO91_04075 [FCB group bacterium]|nr:hypothetical protein [FCB group bacterium]